MTTPAVDLTLPTPAPDVDVTPSDDEPAAPRFTGTPALDLTQDPEGAGSTPTVHPAIAAQAAAKLQEQDTIVRAASTALREFPKTVTEAVAPIQWSIGQTTPRSPTTPTSRRVPPRAARQWTSWRSWRAW